MIQVTFISNNGRVVSAPENSNLLRVSLREQGGIPFKCGGGLCGTCKCRIETGIENTDSIKDKERKHLTAADIANGYRMACQTFLNGDVAVSWAPRPKTGASRPPATVPASPAGTDTDTDANAGNAALATPAAQTAPAATTPPAARSAAAPTATGLPAATPVGTEPAIASPRHAAGEAFATLSPEWRQRLLDIGPRWPEDIVGNRKLVLEAYTPLLARVPRENIEALRELRYGAHERHRLDVYRRPGLVDAPVVVFVHGGAFIRGDKDSNTEIYANVPRYFARHGCVAVNIEYRLAPEAAYPAGALDTALAVAWVQAHAHEHGGSPSRIILIGHSAGAAHAGAYACDPAARPSAGPAIAGLVLISGRLRADVLPGNPNARAVRAYYGDDLSLYEARSVTTHVGRLDVPVFLAAAEFENTYLDAYTAEFAYRVGMARGRMPRFMQMRGHNHTSIVAHFDSGEDALGRELLEFARDPR